MFAKDHIIMATDDLLATVGGLARINYGNPRQAKNNLLLAVSRLQTAVTHLQAAKTIIEAEGDGNAR